LRAIKTVKDRRGSNRIYKVLRRLNHDGQHTFRSSGRISVNNKPNPIPYLRVVQHYREFHW
jgi:hypothetical protein